MTGVTHARWGLAQLETALDSAGEHFGIRQWVLELGAFNRAKMVPDDVVNFKSVATTNTVEVGADNA